MQPGIHFKRVLTVFSTEGVLTVPRRCSSHRDGLCPAAPYRAHSVSHRGALAFHQVHLIAHWCDQISTATHNNNKSRKGLCKREQQPYPRAGIPCGKHHSDFLLWKSLRCSLLYSHSRAVLPRSTNTP